MNKKVIFLILAIFSFSFSSYAEEPAVKPKRVYVDIVGDLLHAGHVEFFKNAKACGDYLIVGVVSDEDVASYKRVPIMTLQERVAMIQACKYVDEVIPACPLRTTEEYLNEHKIDLVIHGDDFDENALKDWYSVPMRLGKFKTVPYTKSISTTQIIQRIKDREVKK